MRCNKKQYNKIKSKLKKFKITDCDFNFKRYPYLTNNYGNPNSKDLGTHDSGMIRKGTEIHETWNEKIFLEACGVEVEETFTITKDQLLELKNGYKTEKLLEWFPSAFEPEKEEFVEAGKWYKYFPYNQSNFGIFYCTNLPEIDKDVIGYGINSREEWVNEFKYIPNEYEFIEAAQQEVKEALKAEASKRYKVGDYVKCLRNEFLNKTDIVSDQTESKKEFYPNSNELWILVNDGLQYCCLFKSGIWASILPTLTITEAEQRLKELGVNAKIV